MATIDNWRDADQKRAEQEWSRWWQQTTDRPLISAECIPEDHSCDLGTIYRHLSSYERATSAQVILEEVRQELRKVEYLQDAFPRWWPNFGPGILAGTLGSDVEATVDSTWFGPIPEASLERITGRTCLTDDWNSRIEEVTRAAIDTLGQKTLIGYTDIGGCLDILASLYGSVETLMAMNDEPEKVLESLEVIRKEWRLLFERQERLLGSSASDWRGSWLPIMAPGATYPIQCDLSIMISESMFETFVVPEIEELCSIMPYAFYHLDGPGAVRHLDRLLSIENLKGIQWVPGAGEPQAEQWTDLIARIRDAGKLVQVYVSPQGAVEICERIGGESIVMALGVGGLPTVREAEEALEQLVRLGHL